jgi:hypothetical protein
MKFKIPILLVAILMFGCEPDFNNEDLISEAELIEQLANEVDLESYETVPCASNLELDIVNLNQTIKGRNELDLSNVNSDDYFDNIQIVGNGYYSGVYIKCNVPYNYGFVGKKKMGLTGSDSSRDQVYLSLYTFGSSSFTVTSKYNEGFAYVEYTSDSIFVSVCSEELVNENTGATYSSVIISTLLKVKRP